MKKRALLVFFTIAGLGVPGSLAADLNLAANLDLDSEHALKPDVPKLDNSVKPKPPLKGGVQHNALLNPEKPKPLNARVGADAGDALKGKAANNGGISLFKRKARVDQARREDPLALEAQSGIGIIGIKFIMAFGHRPIINRVFPGTPASEKGLQTNDIIVAVDGVPTFGLSKDEVYAMIVGTPNTPVTLSLRRNENFAICKMNRMDFNDIKDPRVRRDYQNM